MLLCDLGWLNGVVPATAGNEHHPKGPAESPSSMLQGCGSADTLMDSSAPTMTRTPWLEAWRAEQGFKCQAAAYLGHLAVGVTVHWFGHVLEGLRRQR